MATQSVDPELEYLTQSLGAQDQREQTSAMIRGALETIATSTKEEVAGIRSYAESSVAVNNIISGFRAETDARNASTFTAWNSDPKSAGNVLAEYAGVMRQEYLATTKLANEIADKKSISFFSNPLDFIVAQAALPTLVIEHNRHAQNYNRAESAHNETVSATTATGQMAKVMEKGTSLAMQEEQSKALLAKAATDIAKVQVQGAQLNIAGYRDLSQVTEQGLSAANQAVHQVLALKQYQLQLQNSGDLKAQREIQNDIRRDQLDSKENDRQAQQQTLGWYNAGAAKVGAAQIADYRVVFNLLKTNNVAARNFVSIGQEIETRGSSAGVQIGATPGEVARILKVSAAKPTADDNSPAQLLVNSVAGATKLQATDPSLKTPDGFDSKVSEIAAKSAASMMGAIYMDRPNIYKAPSIVSIAGAIPKEALNNRFIQENILPLGGGRTDLPTDPDVILGAAKEVLSKEPKRFKEVSEGVTRFFRAAVEVNNSTRDYPAYVLPRQLNYNAVIKSGNLFGSSIADMTKDVDVQRILMQIDPNRFSPFGNLNAVN